MSLGLWHAGRSHSCEPANRVLNRERDPAAPRADAAHFTGGCNRRGPWSQACTLCGASVMEEGQRSGPAVSEHDDILTTEEAAKLLKVSERTLERWRVRRRIPYVEYPRQGTWAPIRFRRTDILEWLRQHVVKPTRNGDQPA